MNEGVAADGGAIAAQVRALARGPSRGRNLTREEAQGALAAILSGRAAPEATGALFMLMRYRGETADEIAGFVDALAARIAPWRDATAGVAAVDWPSYAAGKSRGAPLFLMSARLVAATGRPVLVHGWNSDLAHPLSTRAGVAALGLPIITAPADAAKALGAGVAYAPLGEIDAEALRLLRLRTALGLRSPMNTALRALNPSGAPLLVQGVFHPSYRGLHSDAARLLGQPAVGVIKGGGGEFERHPGKPAELWGYGPGGAFDLAAPPTGAFAARRLKGDGAPPTADSFAALWAGDRRDPFEEELVVATAAAALFAGGAEATLDAAVKLARALWERRLK